MRAGRAVSEGNLREALAAQQEENEELAAEAQAGGAEGAGGGEKSSDSGDSWEEGEGAEELDLGSEEEEDIMAGMLRRTPGGASGVSLFFVGEGGRSDRLKSSSLRPIWQVVRGDAAT